MSKFDKGFFLPVFLILVACVPANNIPAKSPQAINAVIDLRDWDFDKDGAKILSGECFFWNQLLDPDQISTWN